MSEWTPEAEAVAKAADNKLIEAGWCPWSGLTLASCQASICDCFLPRVVEP